MIQKLKISGIAVAALFVLVVVLQNTDSVDTKLLFFTVTMPRAALLFGALIIGFVLGIFTAGRMLTKGDKKPEKEVPEEKAAVEE